MRRLARHVLLDAVAPMYRAPGTGWALLLAGLAAALALGLAFQGEIAERERLEAALGAAAPARARAPAPEALRSAAEAAAVEAELGVPWTRLLADLEAASHDAAATVSLLGVEPDAAKRLVRITGEVRDLPDALAFLRRLQQCPALRNPMLESHERRRDTPEHPVRFKLSAEWRT